MSLHESVDVAVIGGGQAGLAMSYQLRQRGRRHVVLDAGPEIGHVWRSRWDSLALFTPTQYSGLPGMAFPGPGDTYPSKEDVVAYLSAYLDTFDLPIRLNTRVASLVRGAEGYVVTSGDGTLTARQIVVATGPFQTPFIPRAAGGLDPSVVQVHSGSYRNPAQLPEGGTLVVGGGNSGFQIAEELAASRKVDLAVGTRMPSLPQRLLGRDLFWWLTRLGVMRISLGSRLGRRMAKRDVLIGSSERRLRRAGVTFRGRLDRTEGSRAIFADGGELSVEAVVWATGYRPDYSWIEVPGVVDGNGRAVHRRGVTAAPGLYFVGLPWQYTRGSALIGFVEKDAVFLADAIESFARDRAGRLPAGSERSATRQSNSSLSN